ALGHSRRRMIDFTGQNAIRMVLATLLGRLLPGIGVMVANLLTSLVAARLSRRDEYEADEWASALLVKAGIGTAPQKSLFAKLGRITGQAGAAPAWLMSHPKTGDRIAAIEANERKWGLNVELIRQGGSARALHGTPDGPGREGQRDGHEGRVADPARQRHPVRRGAVAG